jgi:predicted nucleotide-binding protein
MARRTTSDEPARADLSPDEKRKAIRRFEALLARFEEFNPETLKGRDDPKITELAAAAQSALEKTFPRGTAQNRQFSRLGSIEYAIPMYTNRPAPDHEVREALGRRKTECIVLLRQAIADLKEDLEDEPDVPPILDTESKPPREAFIVHGHDEGSREAVARFLEKLDIKPIILHERPNKGRTLIEKFEEHGDVGFAVVLLTPDDLGGVSPTDLKPRARQNVILELGYFIGALSRSRVCALKKGDIEQPSDIVGVAYVDYDDGGAWRQKLALEIQAAGIDVDWNKVMKA